VSTHNQQGGMDLPPRWEMAKLENVVEILDSKRVPINSKERETRQGPIPYYGATGQVGWIDGFLFDEELVLLGEDGAPFLEAAKPKAYVIRGKSWVNNHAHVLRARDGIPNAYIKYYLDIVDYHGFVTGTTRLKLTQAAMRQIPVPIAPPDEQKHIVAEIEKQFSRLDEAVANLKRAKANLKRYKAAVLKSAVEGKLTEEWRKAHLPAPTSRPGRFYTYAILCSNDSIYIGHTDNIERRWKAHCEGRAAEWTKEHKPVKIAHYEEYDTREEAADREKWLKTGYGRKWIKRELAAGRTRQAGDVEPASELLKHILAERRAEWNGKGKYREPNDPDTTGLPPLAESWTWANLEQLSWASSYGTSAKCSYENAGPPVLRIPNIQGGRVDLTDLKYAKAGEGLNEEDRLAAGDLLIIRTNGSKDLIGRSAVVRDQLNRPMSYASYLIRFRLIAEPALFGWLATIWDCSFLRAWIEQRAATSAGQHNISMSTLNTLPIPLPPRAEQERIVAEVEQRLSVTQQIDEMLANNFVRSEGLRQAVLGMAFSGKLSNGSKHIV
jgi:type I restriction enzyme S subunit